MKVLMLSHGSRGDVQPFLALAVALNSAGYDTRLGAPAALEGLVNSYGVKFSPLRDTWATLAKDPIIRRAFESNYGGVVGKVLAIRTMCRFRPVMAQVLNDMVAAANEDEFNLVVYQPTIPGHEIAEYLGVPGIPVSLQPIWIPTTEFPNPMLPFRVPAILNRFSYRWTPLWVRGFNGSTKAWRKNELGLRRRRGSNNALRRPDGTAGAILQAFSRHLLPPSTDYPSWVSTTGYWLLPTPAPWLPPQDIGEFVAAGEPPVCIGFGSMTGTDPERVGRLVADAVRMVGTRAVITTGWGGITEVNDTDQLHYASDVPFDWLFPKMAAIVHHGGSGTTGAALFAGRPQVVCPFMTDQPFFARRLQACGVAARPLPQTELTASRLARALERALSDRALGQRAQELADDVRAEDGVMGAVRIIETAS